MKLIMESWRIYENQILKESQSSATIDSNFVDNLGFILGAELGRGQFGLVYSVFDKRQKNEYAIKVVDSKSSGFDREEKNYENIKDFVEQQEFSRTSSKIADLEIYDKLVSDYLPKIYSIDKNPLEWSLRNNTGQRIKVYEEYYSHHNWYCFYHYCLPGSRGRGCRQSQKTGPVKKLFGLSCG